MVCAKPNVELRDKMDFLLKQRLVGAIVLVALGVIFIPMLLEGPNSELVPEMAPLPELTGQRSSIELGRFPDAGDVPAEADVAVLQTDVVVPPNQGADLQPQQDEATVVEIAAPEPKVEPLPVPPKPAIKPEPAKPTGPLGNWVVQVGSFSSEQNALRLRDKLRKAGFVTQVEKVLVDAKSHYRVRVGPYLERAEADRDQVKLNKQLNLKGRVLSYP
jgi:DedD protein